MAEEAGIQEVEGLEERRPVRRPRASSCWGMAGVIAAFLLVSFGLQLPTYRVADWGEFGFYDAGTVLKGDWLLAKGYVPTVDFGYTHGLLPLVYGRVGFAMLGRGAWGYLALTLLAEMGMAWGLARILVAMKVKRAGVILFCAALPLAVMPAYLTLTHVLEGMLIVLALAEQAEGKRARALAILTMCLFVKPSMAYVYGALLVALVGSTALRLPLAARDKLKLVLRTFLPALVVGVGLFVGLSMWVGPQVVVETLLPTTGMKTYAAAGFGFFAEQGRAFWVCAWWKYFVTPVGAFLVAAMVSAIGAAWAGRRIFSRTMPRRTEMLLTLGALHTAFLLGFYGWTGSWSYYSYLAVLGLVLVVDAIPPHRWRRVISTLAAAVVVFSQTETAGAVWNGWKWKDHADGMWVERDLKAEWEQVMKRVGDAKAVVMTNGWVKAPANIAMIDAWFPEAGIPTTREVERVRKQVAGAQYVVRWKGYQGFEDVWNSKRLEGERERFEEVWGGKYLRVLRRREHDGN